MLLQCCSFQLVPYFQILFSAPRVLRIYRILVTWLYTELSICWLISSCLHCHMSSRETSACKLQILPNTKRIHGCELAKLQCLLDTDSGTFCPISGCSFWVLFYLHILPLVNKKIKKSLRFRIKESGKSGPWRVHLASKLSWLIHRSFELLPFGRFASLSKLVLVLFQKTKRNCFFIYLFYVMLITSN